MTKHSTMNGKQWSGKLKTLGTMGKKLDALIHELLVESVAHAHDHNDTTRVKQLIEALPQTARKQGCIGWIHKFTPIVVNGNGECKLRKEGDKGYVAYNIEAARAKPFWTIKELNEKVQTFGLEDLKKLITRRVSLIEKADDNGRVYNEEGKLVAELPQSELVSLRKFASDVKPLAA